MGMLEMAITRSSTYKSSSFTLAKTYVLSRREHYMCSTKEAFLYKKVRH